MRRTGFFLVVWLCCLYLCGCSTGILQNAPSAARSGGGAFEAVISDKSVRGTFTYDGLCCTVKPQCVSCAETAFIYDGTQMHLCSCGKEVFCALDAFPKKSFWHALPAVMQAIAGGNLSFSLESGAWCAAVYADFGQVVLTADKTGKIIHLSIPATDTEISLKYEDSDSSFVPSGH